MSLGDGQFENAMSKARLDQLAAQADAYRAARLAGHKSLLRRLLERLHPHREQPGGDPQGDYGISADH